jgi:hypothetical protein
MLLTGGASGKAQALIDPSASLITRAGVERLWENRALTINGVTEEPAIWFSLDDADIAGITLRERMTGVTLVSDAGGANPVAVTSPWGERPGVGFQNGAFFIDAGDVLPKIALEDFVVEVSVMTGTPRATAHMLAGYGGLYMPYTFNTADNQILCMMIDSADVGLVMARSVTIGQAIAVHFMLAADRSGSALHWVNGLAGAAIDISSWVAKAADSAYKWTVGGRDHPVVPERGYSFVYQYGMWKRSAWLDTHDQGTLAKQRFNLLLGLDAGYAGTTYPVSF